MPARSALRPGKGGQRGRPFLQLGLRDFPPRVLPLQAGELAAVADLAPPVENRAAAEHPATQEVHAVPPPVEVPRLLQVQAPLVAPRLRPPTGGPLPPPPLPLPPPRRL